MDRSFKNLTAGAANDIARLAQGEPRVDVALEILRTENLTTAQMAQLKEIAEFMNLLSMPPRPGSAAQAQPHRNTPAQLGERIISSFKVVDGFASICIPADVSDIEAMKAINAYFCAQHPEFGRGVIAPADLTWYEKLPTRFPDLCNEYDLSKPRYIELQAVVPGTRYENRNTQTKVLRDAGLTFADPREIALICGASACVLDGQNIFEDLHVRTNLPNTSIRTFCPLSVSVFEHLDSYAYRGLAASGIRR